MLGVLVIHNDQYDDVACDDVLLVTSDFPEFLPNVTDGGGFSFNKRWV